MNIASANSVNFACRKDEKNERSINGQLVKNMVSSRNFTLELSAVKSNVYKFTTAKGITLANYRQEYLASKLARGLMYSSSLLKYTYNKIAAAVSEVLIENKFSDEVVYDKNGALGRAVKEKLDAAEARKQAGELSQEDNLRKSLINSRSVVF